MDNHLQNETENSNDDNGQKSLLKTLRLGYTSLKAATFILLILYLLSGIFIVNPNESVFILRLGRLVGQTKDQQVITSGHWRWAWPKPIDEIIRVSAKEVKTVRSHYFWYNQDSITKLTNGNNSNETSHPLRPGIDGYLLTGDSNIVHAQWSISFLITDPVRYALSYKKPETVIRHVLHKVILKQIARRSIADVLYGSSETMTQSVQNQAILQLAKMDIGVTVKNIAFEKREPPQSTIPYFNKVSEANQDEKHILNAAQGYAQKVIVESNVKQAQVIANAEAYRQKSIASIEADKEYFLKILGIYDRAPATALISLHSQALDEVLSRVGSKYIIHSDSKNQGQEIRLMLGADDLKNR